MSDRLARVLICALMTVAAILPIVPPAQAAFYSPKFDPEFDGIVTFQIGDACLLQADGTYSSTGACTLNLITANVFSTADPGTHYTSGFQGNVGIEVVIAGNALVEIS
ncbi:MAG TPA: hypothetical protein VKB39_09635, partial [Candidatus Baltobacteraceae bacterium]|nr:hypothetical protein [Candidatus Baltobacteraceae bacterium]